MKQLLSTYNDDSDYDNLLDSAFGTLPNADEEIEDILGEVYADQLTQLTRQHMVRVPYTDFKKHKVTGKLNVLIARRWHTFYLSQIELNKQNKTAVIAVMLCKEKHIPYKPEEVIQ